MTLWLATSNPRKIKEIKTFFRRFPDVQAIRTPEDLPEGAAVYKPPPETGESYNQNAEIKADYLSSLLHEAAKKKDAPKELKPAIQAAKLKLESGDLEEDEPEDGDCIDPPSPEEMARQVWVIGEDSGLEVSFLKNAPGLRSARYSGPGATDKKNNFLLLKNLKKIKSREARYVCFIVCKSFPELENYLIFEECRGKIALKERGENGFGYDPVFIPEGMTETFGELPQKLKDCISHRAKALYELSGALFLPDPNYKG